MKGSGAVAPLQRAVPEAAEACVCSGRAPTRSPLAWGLRHWRGAKHWGSVLDLMLRGR